MRHNHATDHFNSTCTMAKIGLILALLFVHLGYCSYKCNFSGGVTEYCEEPCCDYSCCSGNDSGPEFRIVGIAASGALIASLLIFLCCVGICCNSKRKRSRNDSNQLYPERTESELPGNTSTIESQTTCVESPSENVNPNIPQTGVYSYDQSDSLKREASYSLQTVSKDSANGATSYSSEDSNIHEIILPKMNINSHSNSESVSESAYNDSRSDNTDSRSDNTDSRSDNTL